MWALRLCPKRACPTPLHEQPVLIYHCNPCCHFKRKEENLTRPIVLAIVLRLVIIMWTWMSPGQRTGPETLGWKQKLWRRRDGLAIKSMGFFSSGPELTPCIYMRQLTTTPTAVPGSPWLPRAPALRGSRRWASRQPGLHRWILSQINSL